MVLYRHGWGINHWSRGRKAIARCAVFANTRISGFSCGEYVKEAKYNLKVVNYAILQRQRDKLDVENSLLATRTLAMELGGLLNRFTFWDDVTELLKGDKNLDAMREMWAAKVQEAKEQLYGE